MLFAGEGDSFEGMGPAPGTSAQVLAWARVLTQLDTMMNSGQVTAEQMSRLKNLGALQEALGKQGRLLSGMEERVNDRLARESGDAERRLAKIEELLEKLAAGAQPSCAS